MLFNIKLIISYKFLFIYYLRVIKKYILRKEINLYNT